MTALQPLRAGAWSAVMQRHHKDRAMPLRSRDAIIRIIFLGGWALAL